MTPDGYRAAVKQRLGLTPCRPSCNHTTLHQTRDGSFIQVPDPEFLSPEERVAMIEHLAQQLDL
jgi:hypothetical protein